jgi:hypothetical protein
VSQNALVWQRRALLAWDGDKEAVAIQSTENAVGFRDGAPTTTDIGVAHVPLTLVAPATLAGSYNGVFFVFSAKGIDVQAVAKAWTTEGST